MSAVGTAARRRAIADRERPEPRPRPALASVRALVPVDEPASRYRWALDPWPGRIPGFPLWETRPGPGRLPAVDGQALSADVLARLARRDAGEVPAGEGIVLGGAADPWPEAETRARRTRRILEALLDLEGLDLSIVTRSERIRRDLDLLPRLADRHRLRVWIAIPTSDRRLAAALEPDAARPAMRLKAMSEIAAARVAVGLRIAPVLPDLTDDPGSLDALVADAAGAGARAVEAAALTAPPSSVRALFPTLERAFPDLVDHARERWEASAALPAETRAGVEDLVARLARKHGIGAGEGGRRARPRGGPQLDLF